MPAPRPRGFTGSSGGSGGRPAPNTPMSERQQMALLMQMTSSSASPNSSSNTEIVPSSSSSSHGPARSRDRNERGETTLHVAAIKGDQDAVKKLIDSGMSPNVTDFAGWTPLHEACNHAHYNVALTLVKAGANVNAKGLDDDTPLHDAALIGHLKLVKMLVEKGADVNAKNRKGKTAVDIAVPSVQTYLMSVRDSSSTSSSGRSSQQAKKPSSAAAATAAATAAANASPSSTASTLSVSSSTTTTSSTSSSSSSSSSSSVSDQKKISLISSASTVSSSISSSLLSSTSASAATPVTTTTIASDEIENSTNTTNVSQSNTSNKDEDDIYEFKSNPKDISNSSGDVKIESRKNEKQSSSNSNIADEKNCEETLTKGSSNNGNSNSCISGSSNINNNSNINTGGGQIKRSYSDVEGNDENADEDNKRKKRKDSENVKDIGTKQCSNSRMPQRQDKGSKQSGGAGKSIGSITSKVNTSLERKSPVASPKSITSGGGNNGTVNITGAGATGIGSGTAGATGKSTDSDTETDETRNSENFGNGGPKVPPLKIVIPQQSTGGDMETGSRNGKNNSNRSHAALPYVVASSSNSNDSLTAEKENASSRCTSPAESTGKNTITNAGITEEKTSKATSEERAQQRVLRSSHRSGGQSVDRGSNNSSPQLQSSSPSPAAPITSTTETNEIPLNNSGKNVNTNSNSSPATQATQNQQQSAETESATNAPSPSASSTSSTNNTQQSTVELHPRKRKIRANKQEDNNSKTSANNSSSSQANNESNSAVSEIHPHDHPFTNCYQMFLNIRKQIEKKHRGLFPIQPRPPQGFKDYLMNRRTYALANKTPSEPIITFPTNLPAQMKELFTQQEKERHKLKMQHIVEKEKLGLTVEQEILRVHGKAARSLACQSLPFSACTIMKDDEIYNMITPEQEEKDRNARSRYNGRLFLSWLQDVDDKWEKIKEAMVLRHHNEAESLHAVQKMDWEWVMKENSLCDYKSQPVIDETHVPMVHVSDDFDLLPA